VSTCSSRSPLLSYLLIVGLFQVCGSNTCIIALVNGCQRDDNPMALSKAVCVM